MSTCRKSGVVVCICLLVTAVLCGQVYAAEPGGKGVSSEVLRRIKARLVAKSEIPSLAKIAPYREAHAAYEWAVEGSATGALVRVFHWIYYDNMRQAAADWPVGYTAELSIEPEELHGEAKRFCMVDTLPLDVNAPLFFDVGQALAAPTDAAIVERAKGLTDQMLSHRDKVRLVAFGDSRTAYGVDVSVFYEGRAAELPVAFNLAVAGSRVPSMEYKARQCAALLPSLEWVVMNASPRMFTKGMSGPSVCTLAGPPWPETLGKPGKVDSVPETRLLAELPTRFTPPLGAGDFFSHESWAIFEGTVRELDRLGVNILIWTPPMRDRSTGDDWISPGQYFGILERLRALTHTYARCFLLDMTVEHRDLFEDGDFDTQDHLNKQGAKKLATFFDEARNAPTWVGRLKISETTPGRHWSALRSGTLMYSDHAGRRYDYVPAALLDLPVLQVNLSDRTSNKKVVVSFKVDRPVRVYLIGVEDVFQKYGWIMSQFQPTTYRLGDFVVRSRDYPAGVIELSPATVSGEPRMMYTVAVEPLPAAGTAQGAK